MGAGGRLALDTKPGSRTQLGRVGEGVDAFIKCTKDGRFNLHVASGARALAYRPPGDDAGWKVVAGLHPLADDGVIDFGGGGREALRYACSLPASETLPRASADAGADSRGAGASGADNRAVDEKARRLGEIAEESALIRQELTAGLRGAERQAGLKALEAASAAHAKVATHVGEPGMRDQAIKQAAGRLAKVAHESGRKRDRDEVSREMRQAKAARLTKHKASAKNKGDRRTFANRAKIHKVTRVAAEPRAAEGRAPGGKKQKGGGGGSTGLSFAQRFGGGGRGKGGGGKGGGGKSSGGKGGGGKGGGKGGRGAGGRF